MWLLSDILRPEPVRSDAIKPHRTINLRNIRSTVRCLQETLFIFVTFIPLIQLFREQTAHMNNRSLMKNSLVLFLFLSICGCLYPTTVIYGQELRPTKHMPLIESASDTGPGYYVLFLTGNGGWRDLAQAVTGYLNEKNVSVLAVNTKKYLWKKKEPEQIALDLEALIDKYDIKWGKSKVVLLGYSMGAEVLPFAVNCMKDSYLHLLDDMILIGPWQKATFKVNLLDYVTELNRGTDIYTELQKMKIGAGYIICDDNQMSICHKDLDGVMDHDFLGGGHHFGKDYNALSKLIGRRLNLE